MSSRKDELQKPPGFPPDPSSNPDLTQLRSRAEQQLQELDSQETNAQWPAEARRVLHELQVHQVELEMQKEELRDPERAGGVAGTLFRPLRPGPGGVRHGIPRGDHPGDQSHSSGPAWRSPERAAQTAVVPFHSQ